MTKAEYEEGLRRVADIQRAAGWSEASIRMYREEHEAITAGEYSAILVVGAGLACDNSRFGVRCDRPQKSLDIPKKVGIGVGTVDVGTEESAAIPKA